MEDLCRRHSAHRIAKVDTGEAAACWKEEVELNGGVVPAWAMVMVIPFFSTKEGTASFHWRGKPINRAAKRTPFFPYRLFIFSRT